MRSAADYAERYRQLAQEHVRDEQVLAVGILSRPGSLGSAMVGKLSPLAAILRGRAGKRASGDLPNNVLAAATPTRVVFFGFRPKGTSLRITDRVREVSRHGMSVTVSSGALARRLTFVLPGEQFELDCNRNIGEFNKLNDGLLATLGVTTSG